MMVSILVTIVKKVKAKGRLRTKQKLAAAE
jgi:hypothetical protein